MPQNHLAAGRPPVVRWATLWDAMQNANFTDDTLAVKIGVQPRNVAMWRSGKRSPTVKKLAEMAQELNVSVDHLLTDAPALKKNLPICA